MTRLFCVSFHGRNIYSFVTLGLTM
jgi:hypothetical protein